MILQYANKGNLRQYLESNFKSLQWDNKLRIAREIVSGLMFLHNENIIHRDLHSKNILIHDDQPQITDFGLSQQINETSKTSNSVLNGMDQYIEPLCFKDKHYKRDKRSDIYSFGIILWEISSGKPPSFNPVFMIITGEKEEPIYGTPPQYIELYKKCWDNNPINRPDTKSILNKLNHLISNETSIKNNESPYLQVRTGEGASKQKTNRQDASILNQYLGETSSRNNEFIIEISSKQNANANAPIIPPPAINIPTSAPIYLPKAPNSPSSISSDSNQQKESTNSSVAKSFIKNLSFFFPARSHNESSSNEIQSSPPYQINDQEKINLNKDIENSLRDKTQTSLNLKKSQLGPDETKELSKVLAKFSNLTLLNLSWNHLGPEGGKKEEKP
ncbi:kinase-like protein [Gigaspora margarita]|uniref:Kinase-like protein n=1 Tax=Gigaspora margarita TaxID=4874 RepID=A0A8H4ATK6_GIGMA|nr:kinase-like protein [Gigaspora margarita]